MSLTDELERLAALHAQGKLSDEEYARAKARAISGNDDSKTVAAVNNLRRSRSDQWIAGVCGGIAAASGIESWIWRLAFAVMALFGGTGVLLYILLWAFVPEE
jgi:phage shock protein C